MDDFKADEKSIKKYLNLRRILYSRKIEKEELFIIIEPNTSPKITKGRLKKWIEQVIGQENSKIQLSAMNPKYNFWMYYNPETTEESNPLGSKLINKLRSAYSEFDDVYRGPVVLSIMDTSIDTVMQKKEIGVTKTIWKDIQKFIKYRPYCFRDREAAITELQNTITLATDPECKSTEQQKVQAGDWPPSPVPEQNLECMYPTFQRTDRVCEEKLPDKI